LVQHHQVRRILTALVVAASAVAFMPSTAQADNVAVTATVLAGTRTITSAAMTTPLVSAVRTASTSGVLGVVVTELGATGVASWSVTADLCGTNAALTGPDCTADPNRLVMTTDLSKKIAGTNLHILDRTVVPTGTPGGTSVAPSTDETFSTTRTIFSNSGQSTSAVYSGIYTSVSTIKLDVPDTASTGAYAGYLVVTLAT
jgi:hypothetical protein